MQDNEYDLCALLEAIRLVKETYFTTRNKSVAAAALILTEIALDELNRMEAAKGETVNE